jgi:hypothetical protein
MSEDHSLPANFIDVSFKPTPKGTFTPKLTTTVNIMRDVKKSAKFAHKIHGIVSCIGVRDKWVTQEEVDDYSQTMDDTNEAFLEFITYLMKLDEKASLFGERQSKFMKDNNMGGKDTSADLLAFLKSLSK